MQDLNKSDEYKTSRLMYIIEAALEYFISIAFTTVYIARLTTFLGFSDSFTGIITAFVSLGCGFQLIAIFIGKERCVKKFVTLGHTVSQLLFVLCYFIPLLNLDKTVRIIVFTVLLLCAYIIHNLIHPFKISWYMSLVDNEKRGSFTANKEIVSLLGGMAFSYGLGAIMDNYLDSGNIKTAFLICGIILFCIMVGHSLTLLFSKEKQEVVYNKKITLKELKGIFTNKALLKLMVFMALRNVATYVTSPYMAVYQNNVLNFTTSFASIIIIVGSFIRVLSSKPIGKFADKYSFANMLIICVSIEALGYGLNVLTHPDGRSFFYIIYYVLISISSAGINSSLINLVYDYIEKEKITSSLAVTQSFSGLVGFFATLLASPIVTLIGANGNTVFGIQNLYAQQLLSLISFVILIVCLLYVIFVIKKMPKSKK